MDSKPEKGLLKMLPIGIIIGIAAMLPGISGAVLAVLFGIYERLVRDLAKLHYYIKADFWFIILFLIGGIVGTVISAKLLNEAMDRYPAECLMFFVGLIAGQIPALYKLTATSSCEKPAAHNMLAFIIGIIAMGSMIAVDLLEISSGDVELLHDSYGYAVMFVIGVVVAISALVPGISHSTILIVFGLFAAFTAAVGDVDVAFIGCMMLGILAGALLFSKVIHYALDHHHRTMMFLILGLTIGSLAALLFTSADKVDGLMHILACICTLAVGLAVSIWSMKMSHKNMVREHREA